MKAHLISSLTLIFVCMLLSAVSSMGLEVLKVKSIVVNEAPEKYWDFEKLKEAPKYQEAKFPESQYPGLQAILYDAWRPRPELPEHVFAYIGYPKTPMPKGGYPGVVMVHGGGGTAYGWAVDLWRSYGYAVIAMDWYNRRPVDQKGKKKVRLPGTRKDHDYVVNAANMILAHSLLRSLPKVNPEKIGYMGLSWGSWYGVMVAAVDPRFKCAVEIYCGDYKYDSTRFINGRFLHAAKIPMYWVAGTYDQNVTPMTLQEAFARCPTIWNKSMIIDLPHAHCGFRFSPCRRVMDHFLQNKAPLPILERGTLTGDVLSAKILNPGAGIQKAVLCYTLDRDVMPVHKRKWLMVPAEMKNGVISARLPKGIFQAYLSAYDDPQIRNFNCGSSDIFTFK